MKECENCLEKHPGLYGSGRFCSVGCSRSFSTKLKRKDINKKVSDKLSGDKRLSKKKFRAEREIRKCPRCDSEFEVLKSNKKKYCSIKCTGGYREGSGRSKSGYYKGIFCGSTYELVYLIYRIDNQLPVSRFEGYITDGNIRYYPDFVEGNHIIEIKGYHTDSVDEKKKIAEQLGYTIELKYKKDLKTEFEWVEKNYQYNKIEELYDSGGKFNCICDNCGSPFHRAKSKLRGKRKFCSNRCSALYNRSKK